MEYKIAAKLNGLTTSCSTIEQRGNEKVQEHNYQAETLVVDEVCGNNGIL